MNARQDLCFRDHRQSESEFLQTGEGVVLVGGLKERLLRLLTERFDIVHRQVQDCLLDCSPSQH
jgi:hypothetical protein